MGIVGKLAVSACRLMRLGRAAEKGGDGLSRGAVLLLQDAIDPAVVSERETRDGRLIQYIEGWAAISLANRIFGFDGWSTEVVGEVAFRPLRLADPDSGELLAVGMYSASVRLSVRGCLPKLDVGCGYAYQDTPEAHETAYKGAVTDAMKRALRHFGDQFGNRLYDRRVAEAEPSNTARPTPPAKADELRRKVVELSARLGADEAKAHAWALKRYGGPLDSLDADQLADAVRFLADRLNQRNGAKANHDGGSARAA